MSILPYYLSQALDPPSLFNPVPPALAPQRFRPSTVMADTLPPLSMVSAPCLWPAAVHCGLLAELWWRCRARLRGAEEAAL